MRVRLAPVSRPRDLAGLALRPGVWTPVPEALRAAVAAAAALLGPLVVVDVPAPDQEPRAPVDAVAALPARPRRARAEPVPAPEAEG